MTGSWLAPAVLTAALCLPAPAGARTAADDMETPGVNDLRLQVERLERAEQADVVGSEASAMLFDPRHRAAVRAAEEARRRSQRAVTALLFLGGSTAYRSPVPTEHLFAGAASARAKPVSEPAAADDGPGWSAGPLAVVALVAGGAAASVALNGRRGHPDD